MGKTELMSNNLQGVLNAAAFMTPWTHGPASIIEHQKSKYIITAANR